MFGIWLWSSQGPVAGIAQVALSAGLLLLLIGRAGPLRFVLGTVLAVLILALQLAGAAVLMGRDNPLAELNASAQGFGSPVTRLEGEKVGWTVELPEGHWR